MLELGLTFETDWAKVKQDEKYPMPRLEDILERMKGVKVFSVVDLKSGYQQYWWTKGTEKNSLYLRDSNHCTSNYIVDCIKYSFTEKKCRKRTLGVRMDAIWLKNSPVDVSKTDR